MQQTMATDDPTRRQMRDELLTAGVKPGGVLLVHASFRSLGTVPGGEETVIASLLDALGGDGTLLMPALSYASVTPEAPCFDVRHTPSCVGWLPEYFRTQPGTLRSVHPTHSVSGVGARAAEILADHELDTTPCGPNSAFRRLRDLGGQVLMLGCGLKPNTSMHAIEELVEPPYLFGPTIAYRVVLPDGGQRTVHCKRHNFHATRFAQRYDRLGELMADDEMTVGRLRDATTHVLEAPAMWRRGIEAIRRDPLHFVEHRLQ